MPPRVGRPEGYQPIGRTDRPTYPAFGGIANYYPTSVEGQYRQTVEDAVVVLEPHSGIKQWAFRAVMVVAFFFGEPPEPGPRSAKVVIRSSDSGRVLYSEGPYDSQVAELIADEAVRVIRSLGVDGYIRRERLGR